jgi:ferredoxin
MAIKNVKVDKEACMGCGQCVTIAEKTFELGKDGISHVKSTWKEDDPKKIKEAEEDCPVNAIEVEEE